MNIQEYISSGILEGYVLGSLSEKEKQEVENIASKYPEVQKEIENIREAVDKYSAAHAKNPPAGLKSKILSSLGDNKSEDSKIISLNKKVKIAEYLAAASISLAILTGGMAYYFYDRWKKAEDIAGAMGMENSVISQRNNSMNYNLQKNLEETTEQLKMMMDSSTMKVSLKGMEAAPDAKAMVYWNKDSKIVYLDVKSLPPPPDEMQYQLWAIKDGKPVDAGVFEMDDEMQKMKEVEGAQAFAVTLEKKGGNASPTMSSMVLMGKI